MKKNERIWRWLMWGLFTAVTVFLASRHELWYDEYHVYYMCQDMSLPELWRAMTEEGHFIFWHLLILPFVRLGFPLWCLQLVSVTFVSAAAWLLVMRAPFEGPMLCLILFSYPMIYEFPVVARCYALIPPILFALAALYRKQDSHPWLYCFLVGLLAHTHAYMEGLVAALFLLYLYEQVYVPWKAGRPVRRRILPAVLIVAMVFLAFIQVSGSFGYGQANIEDELRGLTKTARQLGGAYSLLFSQPSRTLMLGGDWQAVLPLLIVSVILIAGMLVLLYRIFWKRRANRRFGLVLLAAFGFQLLFSIKIYYFANQRVYLPMLMIFYGLWCVYEKDLRREVLALLFVLFLLTARDIPFSDITHTYYKLEPAVNVDNTYKDKNDLSSFWY